ncbi:dUTP diphosphatase [Aneurinibacillus migulanus]|uniref:dUTP diphosphatase n=1 Tax=Aneurinibacillus migulanus TaxID=47500 RepID=UPI0020A198C1|nr:dUTP diphosphatase [Aneurinibacillus migulanus]MCP1355066.1 dUTP diphosphatase [Aneurinibacillus migulanus]
MNLSKLFDMQRVLDERIIKDKGLEGKDLLPGKILALQVELGELANEWRGFKFWSNDMRPRIFERDSCPDCAKRGFSRYRPPKEDYWCETCAGCLVIDKNPMLEEYVDCLHFILSIGLEIKETAVAIDDDYTKDTTTESFIEMFGTVWDLMSDYENGRRWAIFDTYERMFNLFIGIGEKHLGFTWEQIKQAYLDKNAVNHQRQEAGY